MKCFINKNGSELSFLQANGYWSKVNFNDLKIEHRGLLMETFEGLQKPVSTNLSKSMRFVLPKLKKATRNLLGQPTRQLSSDDIRFLFASYESVLKSELDKKSISPNGANNHSNAFRTFLKTNRMPLSDGVHVRHINFKTKLFPGIQKGRELISDLHDEGCLLDERYKAYAEPLSSIPFTSEAEFMSFSLAHMKSRVARIEESAWAIIDDYYALKNEIQDVLQTPIPIELKEIFNEILQAEENDAYRLSQFHYKSFSVDQVSSLLFNHIKENILSSSCPNMRVYGSRYIEKRWEKYEYILRGCIKSWAGNIPIASIYMPPPVMSALRILLMINSGWNNSTVLNIRLDDITTKPNGAFHITSIKPRSDQIEEMTIHPTKDKELHEIITKLLSHRMDMQEVSQKNSITISDNDKNLLFCTLKNDGNSQYNFVFGSFVSKKRGGLAYFKKRFNISIQNIEQIRPQIEQIKKAHGDDIELSRAALNHSEISTTDLYITSTITKRLNESRLKLFKEQLATGAIYAWGGSEMLEKHNMDKSKIRPGLYFPIGNGLSCEKPYNRDGNLCEKETCLDCSHKKFIIDENSVEYIARLRKYYKNNWRELYSENKAKFLNVHADLILMNLSMYEFLKGSEASEVLKQVESKIEES